MKTTINYRGQEINIKDLSEEKLDEIFDTINSEDLDPTEIFSTEDYQILAALSEYYFETAGFASETLKEFNYQLDEVLEYLEDRHEIIVDPRQFIPLGYYEVDINYNIEREIEDPDTEEIDTETEIITDPDIIYLWRDSISDQLLYVDLAGYLTVFTGDRFDISYYLPGLEQKAEWAALDRFEDYSDIWAQAEILN